MIISNITTTTLVNLVQDTLDIGKLLYIDRIYLFATIPSNYIGLNYIQTSNNGRYNIDSNYLQFDIDVDVNIYLAYDDRNTVPAWLSEFIDTGENLIRDNNLVQYSIYSKQFPAGHITLPGSSILSTDLGGAYVVILEEVPCNTPVCDFIIAQDGDVTSIEISPSSASINLSGTQIMTAVCLDHNGNNINCPVLYWNSSNSSVATIVSTGYNTALVTGISIGSTYITANNGGN